ncbi:MAG: phosphatase PAP2 family protein [Patescibacteria group bacterium]|nr:phosphatase PAP2 family protein [Patescibacteria group bacterium]
MAILAIASAVLAYIVAKLCGMVYYDPRPFVVDNFTPLIAHAADNGFPSDHALLVSVVAMIGTIWEKKLGMWLWIIAITVGIARVYVGVHHTTDVVGSAVIAIAATVTVHYVIKRHLQNRQKLPPPNL